MTTLAVLCSQATTGAAKGRPRLFGPEYLSFFCTIEALLKKWLSCAILEKGLDGAKERDTQDQRVLASPLAAPVVACEHRTANVVT